MTSIRTRPRFRTVSKQSAEELKQRIKIHLENYKEEGIIGKVYDAHCSFDIGLKDHHFWSPHLNVNFDENEEEGGTIIRGRYGPAPTIWTVFMFGYGALGISFTFAALYGLSELALKQEAAILWVLPFLLGGILTLWLSGQTGQKLGVEQTFRIHQFFEEAIGEKVHVH
ncbi:hypothetical protein [Jiulongibacter sediminis]|jgi:hypothetical protein|uniref:Uncharacterized protein n=1 Tax=Jiulongibacter sediminis TaxID=1605367 RepID=A0A0P7C581_9BACT|nr:hypothetical protein [Jiulongibacter sediminis]KPM47215.1 hypothetical protein AFM12_15550 [Jiulongibacter sediminis]TBX22774.1 hypothetical protein TK44_15560 [Jiulongibacter sediminis]